MATYQSLGSYTTVRSYAPGTSLVIQMISFVTSPTGIFCEYGVAHEAFIAAGGDANNQPLIQSLTDSIENVAAQVPCVTGGTFVQDVDQSSGLLSDFVQFFLSYTPANGLGPFTTYVNVPVSDLASSADISEFQAFLPPGAYTSPVDAVSTACAALRALGGG